MRILALDIGTYAVKAVEFDVTFGRVELGDYLIERVLESELAEVQSPELAPEASAEGAKAQEERVAPRQILTSGQVAALRRLLAERELKYDRLIVNVPKAWITTRLFQFPTRDRKTIQNSLGFELDDDIPFGMNDVIYDFAVLNSEGNNSTVFAGVALKSDLTQLLSELQMLRLDPDTISVESWGTSHLLKRAIPKDYEGRPVCVVNMGNKYTSVHMFVNETPVMSHVSTCAGVDITRAIAQAYNLSFDEAEKAKIDGAFLLTNLHLAGAAADPITDEQKQFAGVIADALMPLVREIKQTLMSYKAQYKIQPRAVFITGGTSLIPNMQLYLEEQLQLPVFALAYMSRIVGQTLQLSETSEAQIAAATGLALSVVKIDRNAHINFRKDDFAKAGGMGAFDLKAFGRPLKYVAASLLFVYANLIVQSFILSSRSANQQALLERTMKSVLGPLNSSQLTLYRGSPTRLHDAVTREISKYKNVQVAKAPKAQVSAFDVLNQVSSNMPKDITLDVSDFQLKDGKLKITGVVDTDAAIAKIQKAIEDTELVSGVNKDKSEPDPRTKKVRFELSGKVDST